MKEKRRNHVSIGPDEFTSITDRLRRDFKDYLSSYGVKFPNEGTQKYLWLVYLKKFQKKLVHKDEVSAFVEENIPNAGRDQQVRHLAADGWYVLNKGDKLPDIDEKVKPGWHMLVTTESPKPNFLHKQLKRVGRVAAKDFESLKAAYDFRCVNCGSQEGKPHRYEKSKVTILHQGHMNPDKALTLTNMVPQCETCNAFYKDEYVFDESGRVKAIANTGPVLRAAEHVKAEVLNELSQRQEG
ncbi:MAG TPA: hypothetical protein ENK28_00870 [Aliiroseovarius sp.]|nr:hypothetical protein [Aliiroseovarius sp.]